MAETGHDDKLHNQTGIQGSPAVANGTVFFGCSDSNVYALDAKTGKLRWKQNNKGTPEAQARPRKRFLPKADI